MVFVEVILCAELDVEFEVAGFVLYAEVCRFGTEAFAVRAFSRAVQVLEEVDLLGLGVCEVDVVLGCDWVVVVGGAAGD